MHAHLVHYLFDSLRVPSQHDRPAAQVLQQSSSGMAPRAAAKASAAINAGCVCVACLVACALFFCAAGCLPFSVCLRSLLGSRHSLRRIDFLCVWPGGDAPRLLPLPYPDLLQHSPRCAACQYSEPLACCILSSRHCHTNFVFYIFFFSKWLPGQCRWQCICSVLRPC